MRDILLPLIREYKRLLELQERYREWSQRNPSLYSWDYPGERPAKAEIERLGIIIRKTMVDYERNI